MNELLLTGLHNRRFLEEYARKQLTMAFRKATAPGTERRRGWEEGLRSGTARPLKAGPDANLCLYNMQTSADSEEEGIRSSAAVSVRCVIIPTEFGIYDHDEKLLRGCHPDPAAVVRLRSRP